MSDAQKEPVTLLRWFAILCGLGLFVSDFGLDVWAKAVPPYAYMICGAIAIGVDAPSMRAILLKFLEAMASGRK